MVILTDVEVEVAITIEVAGRHPKAITHRGEALSLSKASAPFVFKKDDPGCGREDGVTIAVTIEI